MLPPDLKAPVKRPRVERNLSQEAIEREGVVNPLAHLEFKSEEQLADASGITIKQFENPLYKIVVSESNATGGTDFTHEALQSQNIMINQQSQFLDQVEEQDAEVLSTQGPSKINSPEMKSKNAKFQG